MALVRFHTNFLNSTLPDQSGRHMQFPFYIEKLNFPTAEQQSSEIDRSSFRLNLEIFRDHFLKRFSKTPIIMYTNFNNCACCTQSANGLIHCQNVYRRQKVQNTFQELLAPALKYLNSINQVLDTVQVLLKLEHLRSRS